MKTLSLQLQGDPAAHWAQQEAVLPRLPRQARLQPFDQGRGTSLAFRF